MHGVCHICQCQDPLLEEHHIVPQAVGGATLPTILICSGCHTKLHKQAVNIIAKNATRRLFFTPDQLERAAPYVNVIARTILHAKENPKGDHPVQVTLKTTRGFRTVLHTLKMDAGFTNLEQFCMAILIQYAQSKGMPIPKTIQDK